MTSLSSLPVPTEASLIQIINGQPMVSSKDLALRFQKKHKEILRDIERMRTMLPKGDHERDFAPMVEIIDIGSGAQRQNKYYLLSEQAFYVISTGFTGRAATLRRWELVAAFLFFKDAYFRQERESLSAQVIEARQRMLALETGMEQARREARAEGAKVALSLKPSDKTGMRKILAYRRRGLSLKETGKLMDLHQRKVGYLIKVARTMGLEA